MVAITKIHDAIHSGIRKSSKTYSKWSNGDTLKSAGAEWLLVMEISAAVHRLQSEEESLRLEVLYNDCRALSGAATAPGRPRSTFKGTKRADIALFNGNGETEYVIEVKRVPQHDGLHKDLRKLCDVVDKCSLQEGGTLQRSFLASSKRGIAVVSDSRQIVSSITTGEPLLPTLP